MTSGVLIFSTHEPMVLAASLAVAIEMCRQKYPHARVVGGSDYIGIKIVDDVGLVAYYLTPEDWSRLQNRMKDLDIFADPKESK